MFCLILFLAALKAASAQSLLLSLCIVTVRCSAQGKERRRKGSATNEDEAHASTSRRPHPRWGSNIHYIAQISQNLLVPGRWT